jgi:superfamily II DNA/RNA helicase
MTTFSDLSLDPRVLSAVIDAGYTDPTPIQVQAIPSALEGRDVLGIAQTGTGKTAAFVLPMIHHLSKGRARARMPRSLVLCPTRELAAQVAENFEKYAKNVRLSMALLIGGVSFKDQDKLIDRGVDVLIATPGRLLDHFERGKLMLTGVNIMVVDEADRMLDMGFIPDIERIFKLVPFTRQTLFFSATMAPEITRITEEFLHNPVRVEVARQATTSETILQAVVKHTPRRKDTGASEKREVLRRLIVSEGEQLTNGIIFCNRKIDVDVLAKSLKKHGFDAAALHGDLDQKLRMKILQAFRDGELKLLIASDVAARGLDIPNVSHVFNFDVPIHSEDYVHRIGRTGRAGRSGKSITLCLPHEQKYLDKIEELVKKPIPVLESPLAGGPAAVEPEPVEERSSSRRRRPERRESGRESGREGGREVRAESRSVPPAPVVAAPAPVEAEPVAEVRAERPERPERSEQRRPSRRDDGAGRPGMGDHVPAFLLRSFTLDPEPVAEAEPEAAKPEVRAPEIVVAAEPVMTEAVEPVAAEAPAAVEAPVEAPAETPVETPVVAEKPKRVRAPRKRTPKAKVAEPAAEVPAEATPAEPQAEAPLARSQEPAEPASPPTVEEAPSEAVSLPETEAGVQGEPGLTSSGAASAA